MTTLGLKNVNLLSKEQYDTIADPVKDELYAISGSGFGFPSGRYEDLELGASGTEYTAPANGWFVANGAATSSGAWITLSCTGGLRYMIIGTGSGQGVNCSIPCKKGQTTTVTWNATNILYLRFVYAEGE